MEIGIIGLPLSGKTTVFNALVHSSVETGGFGGKHSNIGVAHVQDPRLERLASLYKPQRIVPAEVRYVDIPGQPPGLGKSEGFRGEYLLQVSQVDVLLHVVRAFHNEAVPHIAETVDPARDVGTMELELAFADLAVIERRLQRIQQNLKGARPEQRRQAQEEEQFLARIKASLEGEKPLREMTFTLEEEKALANYQFLTAKPLLTLLNVGENDLGAAAAQAGRLEEPYGSVKRAFTYLPARLEEELAQLSDEEAQDFRGSLELEPGGIQRVTLVSRDLLGLITFFTAGEKEVRAWTVTRGALAPQAAGKIHSDMERGFIRAEVVHIDDLLRCGSEVAARRQGLLRQEGKAYVVQDGDVIIFLFNV